MWTKIWNVAEVFMSSLCLCVLSPHIYNCIDWRWGKLSTLTWPRCESWSKRINGCLLLYYVLRWLSNSVPFLLHVSKDVFCPQCGRGATRTRALPPSQLDCSLSETLQEPKGKTAIVSSLVDENTLSSCEILVVFYVHTGGPLDCHQMHLTVCNGPPRVPTSEGSLQVPTLCFFSQNPNPCIT